MPRNPKPFTAPCEFAVWYTIPAIRREVVRVLVEENSLKQRQVAEIMGLTEAAVSQYLHGKRGSEVKIGGKAAREIRKVAEEIARRKSSKPLAEKICSICRMVTEKALKEGGIS